MKYIIGPCVIDENTLKIAARVKGVLECFDVGEFWFKGSFDKANRTGLRSYRGLGLYRGLAVLDDVRKRFGFKITTDVHEVGQVPAVAGIVDLVQIPALLCRQTDLLVSCGKHAKAVSIKKGQFLAPWDMGYAVEKVEAGGCTQVYVIERGTSFGYNRLVVDMQSFPVMAKMGLEVIFDCTHSLQLPGAGSGCSAGSVEYVIPMARAAVAAGAKGIFMEVCLDQKTAKCDGPNSVPVDDLADVLKEIQKVEHALR